jgi:hypothetical protein
VPGGQEANAKEDKNRPKKAAAIDFLLIAFAPKKIKMSSYYNIHGQSLQVLRS